VQAVASMFPEIFNILVYLRDRIKTLINCVALQELMKKKHIFLHDL